MNKDFWKGCLLGACLAVWFCKGLFYWVNDPRVEKKWHDEAVRRGHAEYYVDGETFESKWRWLDLEEIQ